MGEYSDVRVITIYVYSILCLSKHGRSPFNLDRRVDGVERRSDSVSDNVQVLRALRNSFNVIDNGTIVRTIVRKLELGQMGGD